MSDCCCVIDIYNKCACAECGRRPNNLWVDKGSEFFNRSVKSWLHDNNIGMYSPHKEEKSVVDRFIRTLKTKI